MKKITLLAVAISLGCSFIFAGTVSDRDGNKYQTVIMGNLEWMAEDSKFEAAGSECIIRDADPDNCVREYGKGINDKNMCPDGWRLPTVKDLDDLQDLFLPKDFEQMTEKQKRHALPEARKAFGAFLDSKRFPVNSWESGKIRIYHVLFGQSLRSFYRPAKEDFFFIDGMSVALVRCVKDVAGFSNKESYVEKKPSKGEMSDNANLEQKKSSVAQNEIKDSRDGNVYRIVSFKGRTWFAENLKFATKDAVCYDNNSENCQKYGRLYSWNSAMKACPNGWRLPSEDEWENAPLGIWNEFAGYFYVGKRTFYKKDAAAYYWTKSESDSDKAFDMDLNVGSETFVKKKHSKTDVAFSVRCIKK